MFGIALLLLALYILNVALGMLAVKAGMTTWRFGDVGEFLLVLSCMAPRSTPSACSAGSAWRDRAASRSRRSRRRFRRLLRGHPRSCRFRSACRENNR
jgi:hypothetical protein